MANRTRDYYRKMRKKTINRKKRIINSYRQDNPPAIYNKDETDFEFNSSYGDISPYWCVKHNGMLSKGKIHCSCSLCSFHGTTMQDRRKLVSMESKLSDYYNDDESVYIPNLPILKSKLKKEINGVYHPNATGYPGTTISNHSTLNYDDFEKNINEATSINKLYTRSYSVALISAYKQFSKSYSNKL